MFSISALKVLDRAILPAVLIISTKVASIFIASMFFGIPWEINNSPVENNFLMVQFESLAHLSAVTNFADTIVVLVSATAFGWVYFQAHHLNINKTHPTIISNIYSKSRHFWLSNTGKIYHSGAVWLALSWIVLFIVTVDVYAGLTSEFVLGLALSTTLGLSFAYYKFVRSD